MYRKYMALFITLFIVNGCGAEEDSTETSNVPSVNQIKFTYETQRAVKFSLTTPKLEGSAQRQVLLFETQKTIVEDNTPGDIVTFDSLLIEGNSDNNGKYETSLTVGGHIDSIWIVIPSLAYQKKIDIENNQIVLNITEGF